MSNFRIGEWEAYLEYKHGMMGWFLYLGRRTLEGRDYLTQDGTIKAVKQGAQFKDSDKLHFAYFEDAQQLQAIADAISSRGIKSQSDHTNEGLLKAMSLHLFDMRAITYKHEGIMFEADVKPKPELGRSANEQH